MWLILIFFALSTIVSGVSAYQQGRVTLPFIFSATLLALILVSPAGASGLQRGQWLVVPGGVLLRRARWTDKRVKLHLFDRRTSVLGATEMRGGLFYVSLCDAGEFEKTGITRRELEILLRAWLSPLPPPKLEHLSDFE